MKRLQFWIIALTALSGLLLTQGCLLLVAGAAAGGTVSYVGDELRVIADTPMDRAWVAANAAMKDMEYTVIPAETHKDAISGKIGARNARDQKVLVQLFRQTDKATEVRVRVGAFDTSANKAAAQAFYDKMKKRL